MLRFAGKLRCCGRSEQESEVRGNGGWGCKSKVQEQGKLSVAAGGRRRGVRYVVGGGGGAKTHKNALQPQALLLLAAAFM